MQESLPHIFKVYRDDGSGGWGYSYFIKRSQGNLFFPRMAKTAAIQNEYAALHTLGGIQHIYITDYHFAGEHVRDVSQEFGADICCSEIELAKIAKQVRCPLMPFEYTAHEIEPHLNVIPTPGHTTGGVCYLLTLDDKRYLLTGDFLYFDGQHWIVSSKDYNRVKDSLNRLQELGFDVLLGCGDDQLGCPWLDFSDTSTKTQFFSELTSRFNNGYLPPPTRIKTG